MGRGCESRHLRPPLKGDFMLAISLLLSFTYLYLSIYLRSSSLFLSASFQLSAMSISLSFNTGSKPVN